MSKVTVTQDEKYSVFITKDTVEWSDNRFSLDNPGVGNKYKVLNIYIKSVDVK